jgi:hypothetical protein
VLEELVEMATESMQTSSQGLAGEALARWRDERNGRLNNLVQLYCAHKVADEVSTLDSTLTDVGKQIEYLRPV